MNMGNTSLVCNDRRDLQGKHFTIMLLVTWAVHNWNIRQISQQEQ